MSYKMMLIPGRSAKQGTSLNQGKLKEEKFHGKGKLEFPSGDKYEGRFIEGIKNGYGKFTSKSFILSIWIFKNTDI